MSTSKLENTGIKGSDVYYAPINRKEMLEVFNAPVNDMSLEKRLRRDFGLEKPTERRRRHRRTRHARTKRKIRNPKKRSFRKR